MLSPAAALMCALTLTTLAGCAAPTEDDSDEALEETTALIENEGISGTKLCFQMTKSATLFTTPTGSEPVVDTGSANGADVVVPKGKARYVLVQRRPGNVKGRVWADANFSGLSSDADLKTLVSRCGLKNTAAAKDLLVIARADRHARRGWMDVGALEKAAGKLESALPNGPAFEKSDLDGKGKPKQGVTKTVRANCSITQSYFGSSITDPTGMASYGTIGADGAAWSSIYLTYGTPEQDGGGITFAYVDVGAPVHVLGTHTHKQTGAHCQANENAKGAKCNGNVSTKQRDVPMVWAEIWAEVDNQPVRGFVPNGCLE